MSFKERRDFCVPPHLKIVSNTHICYSWLFTFHFVLPHTNSKIQSWVFIGRTDAEAETPILWPPHAKSWLVGKDPDAGRDWGQEEKGMTEDEMAGWHHWLDAHEFGWTPGVHDGKGGLACCDSWGHKESNTTEWLNWTNAAFYLCSNMLHITLPTKVCLVKAIVFPVVMYEC